MLGFQPISDQPISAVVNPATGGTVYTLTAAAGAYTYSGQAATITRSRLLTADAGAYTYLGQAAGITRSRLITALAGAYGYTGQDATITKTTPGVYTLTAEAGAYSVSGQDASITKVGGDQWGGAKFQYPNWQPYVLYRRDWEKKIPPKVVQTIERIARKDTTEADALRLLEAELEASEYQSRYSQMLMALMRSQFQSLQVLRRQQLAEIARQEQEDDDEAMLLMA